MLSVYEVTAAGFSGDTDETDDRVIWVLAERREDVLRAIEDTGASYHGVITGYVDPTAIDFYLSEEGEIGQLRKKLISYL